MAVHILLIFKFIMKRNLLKVTILSMLILISSPSYTSAFENFEDVVEVVKDAASIGTAFLTELFAHEMGHYFIAESLGARKNDIYFFSKRDDNLYLGLNIVEGLDKDSRLSHSMGGELFASITFEAALQSYRKKPTSYNKALLFFSGTDFLRYSIFSFYLAKNPAPEYDPISIRNASGVSTETIMFCALTQAGINTYRVISGNDTLVPYISFKKDFVGDNTIFIGDTVYIGLNLSF